jgi:hypothetical protein
MAQLREHGAGGFNLAQRGRVRSVPKKSAAAGLPQDCRKKSGVMRVLRVSFLAADLRPLRRHEGNRPIKNGRDCARP